MAKSPAKFQVYDLKENYIGTGEFKFKIVISPRFKTGLDFKLLLVDSDKNKMNYSTEHWGRKLNITFHVSKDTPDGLTTATVMRNEEIAGIFNFWIIIQL